MTVSRFALGAAVALSCVCVFLPPSKPADAAAAPACDLCVGTSKIVCPTRDGKKVLVADCWLCEGKGKRKCPLCTGANGAIEDWDGVTKGKGLLPCPNRVCQKGVIHWVDFGQSVCDPVKSMKGAATAAGAARSTATSA